MKISEYIATHRDEYDYDEHDNLIIGIGSNMLSGVTIDTYSTFTGDSWEESETEYISQIGEWIDHTMARGKAIDIDWDDIDFNYNFKPVPEKNMNGILADLADSMAQKVIENVYGIDDYKVTSTFSPSAYNFATDSFDADWLIDIAEMTEEYGDPDIADIEDRARVEYASGSGFISYIPSHFEDKFSWAILWAYIDQILQDNFDGLFMEVFDDEHEIFMDNVEITLNATLYRKAFTAITGDAAPESITDEATMMDALPADPRQDERLF